MALLHQRLVSPYSYRDDDAMTSQDVSSYNDFRSELSSLSSVTISTLIQSLPYLLPKGSTMIFSEVFHGDYPGSNNLAPGFTQNLRSFLDFSFVIVSVLITPCPSDFTVDLPDSAHSQLVMAR